LEWSISAGTGHPNTGPFLTGRHRFVTLKTGQNIQVLEWPFDFGSGLDHLFSYKTDHLKTKQFNTRTKKGPVHRTF
jgi:hypothetical protein